MPRFLDRLLDLGPTDDPRRVAVAARSTTQRREIVSTPGARVRLSRDGRDPEVQKALLWLVRGGIAVELETGEAGIFVDGRKVSLRELVVTA